MPRRYPQLTFTESVRQAQRDHGSRPNGERLEAMEIDDATLTEQEIAFIGERDGFYMATVTESGWPYVQFRGGPPGFLKVIDPRTLAFADFRGNRQYISTGNLRATRRSALILMDYANRQRMKIMATVEVVDARDNPDLAARVRPGGYKAVVERIFILKVEAFDWNCPQHITPRYTAQEIVEREAELRARIAELERRLDSSGR
jgi:hypothetical protein